jgi:hypothetical protein
MIYEISVSALMRSGHHAIIQWIQGHFDEPLMVLNDVPPGTNPWVAARSDATTYPDRCGNLQPRAGVIYNYEDRDLSLIFSPEFIKLKPLYLGKSEHNYNLIVIRDPQNCFASRIRWLDQLESPTIPHLRHAEGRKMLVEQWKQYAKEYLGITQMVPNKVAVDFNQWFLDEDYRRQLSFKLGLEFNDRYKDQLATQGKSSFDDVKYLKNANEMKVLDRWQRFKDNPIYMELTTDKELLELAELIYGASASSR